MPSGRIARTLVRQHLIQPRAQDVQQTGVRIPLGPPVVPCPGLIPEGRDQPADERRLTSRRAGPAPSAACRCNGPTCPHTDGSPSTRAANSRRAAYGRSKAMKIGGLVEDAHLPSGMKRTEPQSQTDWPGTQTGSKRSNPYWSIYGWLGPQ